MFGDVSPEFCVYPRQNSRALIRNTPQTCRHLQTCNALSKKREAGVARACRRERGVFAAVRGDPVKRRVEVTNKFDARGVELSRKRIGVYRAVGRAAGVVNGQEQQLVLRTNHLGEHLGESVHPSS